LDHADRVCRRALHERHTERILDVALEVLEQNLDAAMGDIGVDPIWWTGRN